MNVVMQNNFGGGRFELDGCEWHGNTFANADVVYCGREPCILGMNTFDNCRLGFDGAAASVLQKDKAIAKLAEENKGNYQLVLHAVVAKLFPPQPQQA